MSVQMRVCTEEQIKIFNLPTFRQSSNLIKKFSKINMIQPKPYYYIHNKVVNISLFLRAQTEGRVFARITMKSVCNLQLKIYRLMLECHVTKVGQKVF